jgi:hypothetical protein
MRYGFFFATLPRRPASRSRLFTLDIETGVLQILFNEAAGLALSKKAEHLCITERPLTIFTTIQSLCFDKDSLQFMVKPSYLVSSTASTESGNYW